MHTRQNLAVLLAAGGARPPPLYRLYAVVCHLGQMEGGHYIAYLRRALSRPSVAKLSSCLGNQHDRLPEEHTSCHRVTQSERIHPCWWQHITGLRHYSLFGPVDATSVWMCCATGGHGHHAEP